MPLRIAMIGAGSVGFTRRLMQDILTVPELADTTFALTDLSEHNMDMVVQLARRDIAANGLPATGRGHDGPPPGRRRRRLRPVHDPPGGPGGVPDATLTFPSSTAWTSASATPSARAG